MIWGPAARRPTRRCGRMEPYHVWGSAEGPVPYQELNLVILFPHLRP